MDIFSTGLIEALVLISVHFCDTVKRTITSPFLSPRKEKKLTLMLW